METIIDKFYNDYKNLVDFLDENKQPSLKIEAENNFSKNLLLAAASFHEQELTDIIRSFILAITQQDEKAISFFENKAMKRQYHTFFQWESNNANSFFGLFGEKIKTEMEKEAKLNEKLDKAIKAFLEIGRLRNTMVHGNYAAFNLEKTAQELYDLFISANYFLERFKTKLLESKIASVFPEVKCENTEE
ncbi:MAG: HEPN domain-containing protein [Ignavibacteriales bacterium]|nr:HEPN domain-containing protein [Ignavibacteriales bacterium]